MLNVLRVTKFQNYTTCSFYACSGTVTLSVCSLFTGDTFFNLVKDGVVVGSNDDGCGAGSVITYVVLECGTYELREGCSNTGSCSGTTYISSTDTVTQLVPTVAPTLSPTAALISSSFYCPAFSVANTASGLQVRSIASFTF